MKSYQVLYKRIIASESDGYPGMNIDNDLHLEHMRAGGYAYITDEMTYEVESAKDCDIRVGKEKYIPMKYGVGMQHNSAYKSMFSNV